MVAQCSTNDPRSLPQVRHSVRERDDESCRINDLGGLFFTEK